MRSEENVMGKKVDANWLRTDKWFFTWNFSDDTMALFDMILDLMNSFNLVDQQPIEVAEFSKRIIQWRRSHGLETTFKD